MVRTYMETKRLRLAVGRVTDLGEDLPLPLRPKFHRESKILSGAQRGENFNRGKYGNFLIETEIPSQR